LALTVAVAVGFSLMPSPKASAAGEVPVPTHKPGGSYETMFIDADLNGHGVLFNHQREIDRNGGKESCAICHHMNVPRQKNSGCYECHNDLYSPGDAFRHDWHASATGARLACTECHARGQVRTSKNVKPCSDCHKQLVPKEATIKVTKYTTPSYADAMHKMCIGCHLRIAAKENKPEIARCAECHTGQSNLTQEDRLLSRRQAVAGRLVVLPPIARQ